MLQQSSTISDAIVKLIDPLNLANELQDEDDVIFVDDNVKVKGKLVTDSSPTKRSSKTKLDEEQEAQIRIGSEFQAICPPIISAAERNLESLSEKALAVWLPNHDIPESMLQTYISLAHQKFSYNIEQALALLYWHKYNIQAAIRDLDNFAPFPDEWTREDKIIFEEALLFHGKNFHRVRELLPDKTVGGIIDYYYSWKKRRGRQRLMERRGRPKKDQ